ncbi:MAG: hypothetical protein KDC53_17880 [Saprospiraceae bacterium]|nr:hypothetical protein [Saprospiraceae bacterium]
MKVGLKRLPHWILIFILFPALMIAQGTRDLISFKDRSLGVTTAIVSDQDDFVWLSTGQGLVRFDGTNFIPIGQLIPEAPDFEAYQQMLYVDKKNQLWIYKASTGLSRIDLNTFAIVSYTGFVQDSKASFYYAAYEDENGSLFLPHPQGIACYQREVDTFNIIPVENVGAGVRLITGTKNDELLFTTRREVYRYDIHQHAINKLPELTIDNGAIAELEVDAEGYLWVSNWFNDNRGLVCYDLKTGRIRTSYSRRSDSINYIASTDIWQILCENDGVYFASNSGGLWFYNYQSETMHKLERKIGYQENSTDQFRSIHRDHFGRLWLGGSLDVYYEILDPKKIDQMKNSGTEITLPSNNVFSVQMLADGRLAVGSDEGLSLVNLIDNKTENIRFPLYNGNSYNNQVNHVLEIGKDLWVCTWSGIHRLDLANYEIVEHYITSNNAGLRHDSSLVRKEIQSVFQSAVDDADHIWFLNNQYNIVEMWGPPFDRNTEIFRIQKDTQQRDCQSIIFHPDAGLLVSSAREIWKFDKNQRNFFPVLTLSDSHQETHLYLAKDQIFALSDDTLYQVFWEDSFKIHKIGRPGYYSDLDNLVIDSDGAAWMTDQTGLLRWDYQQNKMMQLDAELHLFSSSVSKMINVKKTTLSKNDQLFLATNNGVVFLDCTDFQNVASDPKLEITSVLSNGRKIKTEPAHLLKELRLNHRQNNLQISYSILNDHEPQTRSYAYKLNDDNWINVGNQSTLNLSGLGDNDYHLQIVGTTGDGRKTVRTKYLHFIVYPPWYASNVAYLGYLLILLLMGYIFFNYRMQILKREHETRDRIARDLHDEIGSSLTNMSLQLQLLESGASDTQSIKRLIKVVDESINKLRDLVWSVDKSTDQFTNLEERMRDFASDVLHAKDIIYTFGTQQIASEKDLNAKLKQNLFLIFKESINNVVKHSNASKVDIELGNSKQGFFMRITDNGSLFHSRNPGDQYGLKNMEKRAREIGAHLDIGKNGEGFYVELSLPQKL